MGSADLIRARRRAGVAMFLVFVLGGVWFFSPGLPILWGPWASAKTKEAGKTLFEHEWQPNDPLAGGDGLGPVFNGRSCVECHFQGGVGGGGTNDHNVLAFEVHPTPRDPEVRQGVIHAFAVEPSLKETPDVVQALFPVIPGEVKFHNGCRTRTRDIDPVRSGVVNTPALFGAGWIDRISDKAITSNRMGRLLANSAKELNSNFDSLPVGRARLLSGGSVGKFGWKAQFATLEEFVAQACASELGLGTPSKEQARPLGQPHYPAAIPDLDRKQFSALLAFVDTLPRPVEVVPQESGERTQAIHGKEVFHQVGCAGCHTPDLNGVNGIYSDFLLYSIDPQAAGGGGGSDYEDPPELPPLPRNHPAPSEWKTPPLWGVADSAPYFHDGMSPTLAAAILRHGGEAAQATAAYRKLAPEDREAVIAFLKTLRAPPDAIPVRGASETQVAER